MKYLYVQLIERVRKKNRERESERKRERERERERSGRRKGIEDLGWIRLDKANMS